MEKSSHSGISKKSLKREWEEYLKISFPAQPKEDNLAELFAELALNDGHVAGIVESFLSGIKVDKKLIYVKETLNEKLRSYKPSDSTLKKSQEELIEYKNNLDKLVKMVLELYDKY